ncbi:MAG: SIS domain-containing protein [Chloroflexi bacterium]|nr:SIS domain-containing protein [Chloroflexota bacterium]
MSLRDEILEQPAAVRRQLGASSAPLDAVGRRVRDHGIESVVIAARGTSDHAAIYGQYLLGVRNRLSVGLAAPSVISLYDVEPRLERSLVIGISQSGASPDIVAVVAAARRQGAPTLAITNDPTSPLASAAEVTLALEAGPERAVAATKTYTTSLVALARLSVALDPVSAEESTAMAGLPDAMAQALTADDAAAAAARDLAGADRCLVLGRGFEYATAREWALKLKELARVFADPYSAADFLHGPVALVEPGVPALAVAPAGPTSPGLLEILADLQGAGADSVVVSDDPAALALGRHALALPADIPEWLRPVVSILPAQLLAYHLTRARGLDPDAPRGLAKVTRTF